MQKTIFKTRLGRIEIITTPSLLRKDEGSFIKQITNPEDKYFVYSMLE